MLMACLLLLVLFDGTGVAAVVLSRCPLFGLTVYMSSSDTCGLSRLGLTAVDTCRCDSKVILGQLSRYIAVGRQAFHLLREVRRGTRRMEDVGRVFCCIARHLLSFIA